VLGLAISVASTVVLLRALEERHEVATPAGRVAVGWLIVEDLATVIALVLLPATAWLLGAAPAADAGHAQVAAASSGGELLLTLALTLGKVALLTALVIVVGFRVVPWVLHQAALTGSRELFTLAVLAIALGIAFGSAVVFGVSFALGAFLAGLTVSESDLGHRAAEEALPLRDAFAVLFFVSVGMLFDPAVLIASPMQVLVVLALIVVAKPLAALAIVAVLRQPLRVGVTVAAGLAQIGEFSFILAEVGRSLGLIPGEAYSLVLAGALLSITINPLLFRAADLLEARWGRGDLPAGAPPVALDGGRRAEETPAHAG
jgi:CPA2 family monovalent cation:H+ antiporter-2